VKITATADDAQKQFRLEWTESGFVRPAIEASGHD
jgi:hypothetical protein